MQKEFFIFIGRSGSGKGTQAELLLKYLQDKFDTYSANSNTDFKSEVKHFTTGGNFRDFLLKEENYSALKSKEIVNEGKLMPEFLAVWNWSNIFIDNLKENDTVLLDGAPRKMNEVEALDTAIKFYDYKKVSIIYIDVSETWAKERLFERGREDDQNEEEVNRKMNWFLEDVLPCIDFYKNTATNYNFVHVNGEDSIEDIHKNIVKKIESIEL